MEDNHFNPVPRAVQISAEEAAEIQSRFFAQVYGWMAAGLGLTGGIAMFASTSPTLINFVFGTRFVFFGLIILELVIVGFLSARIFAWSLGKVQAAFVGYAMLNGVTLSCVFLAYTSASIASTFFDTQKLKQLALLGVTDGEETSNKASILGALTLYLDFVNLFLFLLRIFGRRR